jgi:hypothetical protein
MGSSQTQRKDVHQEKSSRFVKNKSVMLPTIGQNKAEKIHACHGTKSRVVGGQSLKCIHSLCTLPRMDQLHMNPSFLMSRVRAALPASAV